MHTLIRPRLSLAVLIAATSFGGLSMLPSVSLAQTGYTISGGMSNFDCTNECDEPCDEFEVEIEGIHPEDVVHTYRNGNYGAPTITLRADGLATIIDYRHPQHLTAVHSIEHFGICLRQLTAGTAIRGRWMKNGRAATVNGQIPQPGGGTAPATQPMLPTIDAQMGIASTGGEGVTVTVTNNDPAQSIWIKRKARVTLGVVTLEALMPNDPTVTTALTLDPVPFRIGPSQSVSYTGDLIEFEDNQSVVFAAEYFQDLFVGGLFGQVHTRGPQLGNVMTASIASPQTDCAILAPTIIEQPLSQEGPEGSTINLRIRVEDGDLTTTYQWLREGVALVDSPAFRGVDTDELSIEEITTGSEGLYSCRISNACGTVVTDSALVYVIGHNNAPPRPACAADFNNDQAVSVQDLFDFLNAWFELYSQADVNQVDGITVQDIFDFMALWFAAC